MANYLKLEQNTSGILLSNNTLLNLEEIVTTVDQTGLILDTEPNSFGLASGAEIVQLTNSVAGQNSGIQATIANRAKYQTPVQNGYGSAVFDGLDDLYSFGNLLIGRTAGEIFLVVRINNDPPAVSSTNALSGLWSTGADQNTHFPLSDGDVYDGWGSTTRRFVGNPALSLATAFRLYNVSSSASGHTFRLNGTQLTTFATNTVNFPGDWLFGRNDISSIFFQGQILRILIYSVVKTASERLNIENYLNGRYLLY